MKFKKLHHKKDAYIKASEVSTSEAYFFRVPGGTRTHDIQNHNLTL